MSLAVSNPPDSSAQAPVVQDDLTAARDMLLMLFLAACVGVLAGLGAMLFRQMLALILDVAFLEGALVLGFMKQYYVVLLPALGALLVGPLIHFGAREAKGIGVPEVMHAVRHRGGRIGPRVFVVKTIASALCIGSGGSAGRVGPVAQIGASCGSTFGNLLKLRPGWIRLLVACGAAGGISATFNAPVGGVLFSLEVVLGAFRAFHFAVVVVASLVANLLALAVLGPTPVFSVPHQQLSHPVIEIGFCALLGVAAGVAAVVFTSLLYKCEDGFDLLPRVPAYVKPAIGGILVGCMGLYSHDLFGVGYGHTPWTSTVNIDRALAGDLAVRTCFIMAALKLIATSLTIGSGGSGGIFGPSLFMGSMLGAGFGKVLACLFPWLNIYPGLYALVGMGAFFAGATRAPMTAVLVISEMRQGRALMGPLLVAALCATVVARCLNSHTIYTQKLARRERREEAGRET